MKHLNKTCEKYLTIPAAAELLGIPVYALRRAVKKGLVPSYIPFGSRRLVKLSEILAVIEARKVWGAGK